MPRDRGWTFHGTLPLASDNELACEWIDGGHQSEFDTADERFILCLATLDFDYHYSYLLEVRVGQGEFCDYLFAFQRHAGTDLVTVKRPQGYAHKFFSKDGMKLQQMVMHTFIDWTYKERGRNYDHQAGTIDDFEHEQDEV